MGTLSVFYQKKEWRKKAKKLKEETNDLKLENLNLDLFTKLDELVDRFEYRLRNKWTPRERELFKKDFENFSKSLEDSYDKIVEMVLKNLDTDEIKKVKDELIKKFEEFYKDEAEKIERGYKKRVEEFEKRMEDEHKKTIVFIKKKWGKRELKKRFKEFNSQTLKRFFKTLDKKV